MRSKYVDEDEAHDFVPLAFWSLILVSILLYWCSLRLCSDDTLINLPAPLLVILAMAVAHSSYNRSKNQFYRKNIEMWRKIRSDMKN
jgi:hypothetical protein